MSTVHRGRGLLAGLLAAVAALTVAECAAQLVRPEAAPLVGVGGAVIDATPTPVKEFAVRTFGTYDKPLLLLGLGVVIATLAALAGLLATRRPAIGAAVIGGIGLLGALVAATRPGAGPLSALPCLLGAAAGVAVLVALVRRTTEGAAPPRRRFLRDVAFFGGGVLALGVGAAGLRTRRSSAAARAREVVTLPAAASPAPPRPAGLEPGFVTANADFYRVDVALTVPRPDPARWRLEITGMVDRPTSVSFDELLRRPLIERDITLNCVSNEVGGPYIGTARWLGASLPTLLREAGVRAGADQVVARCADGMTIGTPLETVLDGREVLLCVGMNGEPLPAEHGFPVRMLTPGVYGYAGAAKWLTSIEVTHFDAFDPYWVRRGWAARAPVKTASRVDTPKPFTRLTAGQPVRVAGLAWAQPRGIAAVEVQVDSGPWIPAVLSATVSGDTWTQWHWTWTPTAGDHTIRARATDRAGAVQVERRATPFPDGATGYHTISVTVA